MGSASDYVENGSLDFWLNGSTAITGPTTVYLALFTTGPDDDGTGGTEVSGNSYTRATITPTGIDSSRFTITDGLATNSVRITFPEPTGSWGTIVLGGVYDSVSIGNLLFRVTLSNGEFTVVTGQPVIFPTGELQVTAS
jgi:hypothetical protein